MKFKLIIISAFLLVNISLFAQNKLPIANNNQIGIDIQGILKGNIGPNFIYRRYLKKKTNYAIRLTGDFYFRNSNDENFNSSDYNIIGVVDNENLHHIDVDRKIIQIGIGLEKNKQVRKKMFFYYGVDVNYRYINDMVSSDEIYNFLPSDYISNSYEQYAYKSNTAIVELFYGLKYQFNDTFGLSIEGGTDLFFYLNSSIRDGQNQDSGEPYLVTNSRSGRKSFTGSFDYLKVLNFEIRF